MSRFHLSMCVSLALVACGGSDATDDDPPGGTGDASAPSTLFDIENVPPGDECASGGVRFLVGADDGTGDGEAGDGELHPDEVRSTDLVCFPDAPVTEPPADPNAPPAGATGTHRLDLSGGDGTEGGGRGGDLNVVATTNGSRRVFVERTGSSRAGLLTVPGPRAADLGPVPYTVSTDVTVPRLPDCGEIAEEDLCQTPSSDALFVMRGGELRTVTGLHVDAGATLTLNAGGGGQQVFLVIIIPQPSNDADLRLSHDLSIAGTVNTDGNVGLRLRARSVDIASSGVIRTVGSASGNSGSDIRIDATQSGGGLVVSRGLIDASGADGAEGAGNGGDVSINGTFGSRVAGTVRSRGGASTLPSSRGGRGGSVNLWSELLPVVSTAEIDVRGGNAADGGSVSLVAGILDVLGTIDARGGSALSSCSGSSACSGGEGGYVELVSGLGQARIGASIVASGGAGVAGEFSFGGSGGAVEYYEGSEGGYGYGGSESPADVEFGGEIDLRGGPGRFAGAGGDVYVGAFRNDADVVVRFVGYAEIAAVGGDGDAYFGGGRGGDVRLGGGGGMSLVRMGGSSSSMSGELFLRTDLSLDGGDGGGRGGTAALGDEFAHATIRGDIHASGGSSLGDGGRGGNIYAGDLMRGPGVDAVGAFTAHGGSGEEAGRGGFVLLGGLFSEVRAEVDIDVHGGDGSIEGGDGGEGSAFGSTVFFRGSVQASGGDGPDYAGAGGRASFVAADGSSDVQLSSVDVSAGAGDEPGDAGRCTIDGVPCP